MMIPVWDDQLTVCSPFRSASSTRPEMLYGLDTPGMITHLNLASTNGVEQTIGQRNAVPLMDGTNDFSPFLWETSGCEPFSIALASDVVVATLGKTPLLFEGIPTEWWLSVRSRDDGQELWREDLPSAPLVGGLALDRDGTILCPMADGSIIAFGDTNNIVRIESTLSNISVPEGGTNTFDVRLSRVPEATATVTVSRTSGDTDIQIQGASFFVFNTNDWNDWQTVTLQASEDADWANGEATFQCVAEELVGATLIATEIDNEENPDFLLPFEEPFEATNVTVGALSGQRGWTGDGNVQAGTVYEGTQALSIANGTASHTFLGNATNVWVTFWAKPTLSETFPASIPTNAAAVFYMNTNHLLVAYNSTNAVEIADATILSKVWNLELNDVPRVGNFPFYSDTQSDFDELLILNGVSNAFIDSIQIVRVASGSDTDADGIPDSWEEEHFGGTTNAVATNLCANGINTVLEAYVADLNPTNPASKFLISDLGSLSSENVISWVAASGRVYTVYWASNLLSGFQTLETNVPWTDVPFSDTNHAAEQKGFYKIEVELE